jgi:FkbM family methyltransferase
VKGVAVGLLISRLCKLALLLWRPYYRNALIRTGVGAATEHESVLRYLGCKTVVDVGANRGQFALATRQSLNAARIISFEPLPGPAETFNRLFSSDPKVTLSQIALGAHAGRVDMHVSNEDDSSSLLPITALQHELFRGTQECGTDEVTLDRLDARLHARDIEKPCLLKLDVQGYELEVIKGAGQILSLFDFIYAECSYRELYKGQPLAHQVITHLQGRGFKLVGAFNSSYDMNGMAIQSDFLFAKSEL